MAEPQGQHIGVPTLKILCVSTAEQVCEIIWTTLDRRTRLPHSELMGLVQRIVLTVMALRPRFVVALQKAHAGGRVIGCPHAWATWRALSLLRAGG